MTGKEAYIDGQDHLYLTGSKEFQESYREEWYSNLPRSIRDDDSGISEATAWNRHLEDIELDAEYAKAYTPEPNEPTIDELLSGTSRKAIASNIILGMTAAFISGALFMACLLMDQSEVAAYTAAVLGGK